MQLRHRVCNGSQCQLVYECTEKKYLFITQCNSLHIQSEATYLGLEIIFERKSIKYTIKASLCIQSALQWPCLLHSGSQDIYHPLTQSFPPSNNTFNIQSYRDGHESTFRHGWASASCSCKPPHNGTCVDASGYTGNKRSWQCNERLFLWLHLPVHSHFHPIPSKACFITAGRQTTLLLSHSNYSIYTFVVLYGLQNHSWWLFEWKKKQYMEKLIIYIPI